MNILIFFLGLLQICLLRILAKNSLKAASAELHLTNTKKDCIDKYPQLAVIIPAAGNNSMMPMALESLLKQDYPNYRVYFVTAGATDSAVPLIKLLCSKYQNAFHVIAEDAILCGQKNHNLLAGINAAGSWPEIYSFCDSTHMAKPDFLRCLTMPIILNKAEFTTGYHLAAPQNLNIISAAYAVCVLFMRFLQANNKLTQLWGGAMAMSRMAFARYGIASFWSNTVVDDCSLSAQLHKFGINILHCHDALLYTQIDKYNIKTMYAWLLRQILFLKFCMPYQWLGLIIASIFLIAVPLWCFITVILFITGYGGLGTLCLALIWILLVFYIMNTWKNFIPAAISANLAAMAYFYDCIMFFVCAMQTVFTNKIHWCGKIYTVGKNGIVKKMKKA